MPNARYRFARAEGNPHCILSRDSAGTDTLAALALWAAGYPGRSYDTVSDGDEQIVIELSWAQQDKKALWELAAACNGVGISRSTE